MIFTSKNKIHTDFEIPSKKLEAALQYLGIGTHFKSEFNIDDHEVTVFLKSGNYAA
jgi:hypothetical protein